MGAAVGHVDRERRTAQYCAHAAFSTTQVRKASQTPSQLFPLQSLTVTPGARVPWETSTSRADLLGPRADRLLYFQLFVHQR